MATTADVALSAGVSVATVSHVPNGTRPVLPHTRQAVLDAVDALGYTPNTLARSLVTSRTRSIGLAVSAISNPYFTEILQGVEAAALEAGSACSSPIRTTTPGMSAKVVQLLHERRVDGMIVAPSADPTDLVDYRAATRCRRCSWTGWSTRTRRRTCRRATVRVPRRGRMRSASTRSAPRAPRRRPSSSPTSPGWGTAGSPWSPGCPG